MKRDKAKVPFFSPGRKEERDEVALFQYMQRGLKKKRKIKGRRRFTQDGVGHKEGFEYGGKNVSSFLYLRLGGSMTESENGAK